MLLLLMLLLQDGFDGGNTGATCRRFCNCCNFFRFGSGFMSVMSSMSSVSGWLLAVSDWLSAKTKAAVVAMKKWRRRWRR
jgi:hypothetical protein